MLRSTLLALALAAGSTLGVARADTAIKIGVLNDQSGAYSDLSGPGSVVAARMAIADFKALGPDLSVTLVSADHQNKPDVGAAIARRWYDQDGVDAIFDVPTSSVALAVSDITREKDKVFVASGSGTTDLTGSKCTPNTVQWTYDTYALGNVLGRALIQRGGKTWFFVTADYAFGQALQRDTSGIVVKDGGTVVGSVKTPFPSADFSSFLLQAQGSKAQVIALANAGTDATNAIKQAGEFGITEGGQSLAALLIFSSDIHALTTQVAQGLLLTEPFYWDMNDGTRAFSARFAAAFGGRKPTASQAGVYAGVTHYLKAVEALHGGAQKDGARVVAKMKAIPTDDPLFGQGSVRADGRTLHAMYLFQVKTPAESKGEWDFYKLLATVPGAEAFRPLNEGGCALVGAK